MVKFKYPKDFNYIKLKLASPLRILQWAKRNLPNGQFVGEVQTAETINYRTFKPEMDGLFCERIFGPSKNFECSCGKYKMVRYEGLICEQCGVELTESRVRRHRMGYINLIYPVTHIWYMTSRPNFMALLLEVEESEKTLDTTYTSYSKRCQNKIKFEIEKKIRKKVKIKNKITTKITTKTKIKEKICEGLKVTTSTIIDLWDERIKRIKLASLAYFIAEDEISFYGLHWDLQQYRRSRELGQSGYPLKPYPKPSNRRYNTPKYLLRATPSFLQGTPLIKRELDKLNLKLEISQMRSFILLCTKVLNKETPMFEDFYWFRKWEQQRIYKMRQQSIKRIRILENLLGTGSRPGWMIFTKLPVIPPALRPMIQLEGGRFAISDLNELYRRIINRNNRLLR